MGEIVVAERISLGWSAPRAFEFIEAGGLPGWKLPRHTRLRPGTPISVPVQLPPALGGRLIQVLGRVVAVDPGRRFTIQHDLPWHGLISLTVRADGLDRCRVSVAVHLDEDILQWARRLVAPTPTAGTNSSWHLGLLSSGSGPASVFSVAARNTALMAVEELNADGGLFGRPLELLTGDDGTHPGLGAAELVRLARSGCLVVLANVTSEVFNALLPVARRHGILVVHTPLNEGGPGGRELLRLGERPSSQAAAAIPLLMRTSGGSRFFLAGNDYCWPRAAHHSARRVIQRLGGSVAAEDYLPLGSTDFGSLISSIDRSGADLVVSTFVGTDEVEFEQQMHAAGMRSRIATLALVLDDTTHSFIGAESCEGLWTAFSYFENLDSSEIEAFNARYHDRFGDGSAPVSSMAEAVYEAVHLVARAAGSSGAWDPFLIGEQLRRGVEYKGPRGTVTSSAKGLRQPLYVAISKGGRLTPVHQSFLRTG